MCLVTWFPRVAVSLRRCERVLRRGTCRASKPAQNNSRFSEGRGFRRAWRKDGRPDPPTGGQITVRTAVLAARRRRGGPCSGSRLPAVACPAVPGRCSTRPTGWSRQCGGTAPRGAAELLAALPPHGWRCRRRRAGERQQTKRVPAARQPHGPDLLAECRQEGGSVRRRRARCAAPTPGADRTSPYPEVVRREGDRGSPRGGDFHPATRPASIGGGLAHRSAGVTPHLLPVCGRRIRPQSRTRMRAPGRLTADDHGGELHRAAHPPRPVRGSPTRRLGASAARPGRGSALR